LLGVPFVRAVIETQDIHCRRKRPALKLEAAANLFTWTGCLSRAITAAAPPFHPPRPLKMRLWLETHL
jgi:hypothetical protein